MTSVSIGNAVTTIGDLAFQECEGLTSITIPDGVTSIGEGAFGSCEGLTSITIPDGVTSIGNNAFSYCSNLTSVKIGNGVTSIGNYAFQHCSSLTSINIPDGVTSIKSSLFYYCRSLTSISIPEGVTSIGINAFYGCSSLTSINIPDGVNLIEWGAFGKCSSLTSITIPDGVTSIGSSAFSGCSGLTSITIPKGVTSIENYVFSDCSGLTSITIPDGVTSIGDGAFYGCTNVKKIVCKGDTPPICGTKALEGISRTECTLYVPETSGSNYKNTAPWSEFTNIVGDGTDTPDTPKTCEAPTITFDNNAKKLVFASATDGAECYYTITSDDINASEKKANEATMTGIYTITAYASAEGMYNSEKTTAKLVWVSAAIEGDGILTAKADRGVVVSSTADQINISGTIGGETIEVYNVGGSKVKSVKVTGESTTISGLQSGSVYIVKIGGSKVKVAM